MSDTHMKELRNNSEFVIKPNSIIKYHGKKLDNIICIKTAKNILKTQVGFGGITVFYKSDRRTIDYIWIYPTKFIETTFHDKHVTDTFFLNLMPDFNLADSFMIIDDTLDHIVKLYDYNLPPGFYYTN